MSEQQPVLFLGHGSPMNVISDNEWTKSVSGLGRSMTKPEGIVVISAHWLTDGLKIHYSPKPPTIHDFRGFPKELNRIQYSAPSQKELAQKLKALLPEAEVTDDWGFDHGTWGVLHFLRPQADIPVIPLSLNARSTTKQFVELGQRLRELRKEKILILGSGNLVHNLYEIDFSNESEVFPWARDFDLMVKDLTEKGDLQGILDLPAQKKSEFLKSHPTSEHWAPYLVCLGAASDISEVSWVYEGLQNGSISMRSALWKK